MHGAEAVCRVSPCGASQAFRPDPFSLSSHHSRRVAALLHSGSRGRLSTPVRCVIEPAATWNSAHRPAASPLAPPGNIEQRTVLADGHHSEQSGVRSSGVERSRFSVGCFSNFTPNHHHPAGRRPRRREQSAAGRIHDSFAWSRRGMGCKSDFFARPRSGMGDKMPFMTNPARGIGQKTKFWASRRSERPVKRILRPVRDGKWVVKGILWVIPDGEWAKKPNFGPFPAADRGKNAFYDPFCAAGGRENAFMGNPAEVTPL